MTFLDLDPTALKATSISTLVLLLKWYTSIAIQGDTRFKAGSRAPEDAAFGGRSGAENVEQTFGLATNASDGGNQAEKMRELRWQRIIMNDLENIPLGLIIAWSSLVTPKSPLVHTVSVVTFAVMQWVKYERPTSEIHHSSSATIPTLQLANFTTSKEHQLSYKTATENLRNFLRRAEELAREKKEIEATRVEQAHVAQQQTELALALRQEAARLEKQRLEQQTVADHQTAIEARQWATDLQQAKIELKLRHTAVYQSEATWMPKPESRFCSIGAASVARLVQEKAVIFETLQPELLANIECCISFLMNQSEKGFQSALDWFRVPPNPPDLQSLTLVGFEIYASEAAKRGQVLEPNLFATYLKRLLKKVLTGVVTPGMQAFISEVKTSHAGSNGTTSLSLTLKLKTYFPDDCIAQVLKLNPARHHIVKLMAGLGDALAAFLAKKAVQVQTCGDAEHDAADAALAKEMDDELRKWHAIVGWIYLHPEF
ncbi:hypothetical protein HDU81_002597 [Chytriomyces hyalinus]|nr:hypothetical protein HDU81_002597 [Chytriomyces hyalinus]